MTTAVTKDRSARLPRAVFVIAAIAVVGMLAWSIVRWPDMAAQIVTRESDGRHGTSVVNREVTAVAMPIVLVVMTVLLAVAPTLDAKLMAGIRRTSASGRRASARVLGAFVIGLCVLFPALHVVFVSLQTGEDLAVTSIVGAAAGVLLVILGVYLPLARPDGETFSAVEESFRAALGPASRLGGVALILVGVAVFVAALAVPAAAVFVASGGVVLVFGGIAVSAVLRMRRA
ncbi:hypothetical protein PlfCFBP13513_17520 [Plantibacter flavus]|uniref:hypothetical protein n=1 Tax=Plantibacter TaxID=190323 RepID=UPI0010C22BE3|nr:MULTISPECIES: hypothetical protein [Plantibacter]MBD8104307.1 hypothetical protein [Plantibacter sp. CFBP 8775]MBD8517526.1 hypothetical protein [Plantibacter sp. CFBP 8804]MBD8535400.1 hypothetical protein [Plantibacter sp. CFBP 13570]TKJ95615.1 hypothetical protein PlfCFBP13513_17520 [Plantibacter flavus]CAH0228696.1 hypothetical protein SRABI02_02634 [Plantibacter cousiniae]